MFFRDNISKCSPYAYLFIYIYNLPNKDYLKHVEYFLRLYYNRHEKMIPYNFLLPCLFFRFNAFLNQQRESKIITLKEEGNSNLWSYFTHCAALCVLLSIGICNAPLIHDYTIVYKGSLDDVTLICIIGGILHLFCWIVIWLFLTIKQKWTFKIRITVSF